MMTHSPVSKSKILQKDNSGVLQRIAGGEFHRLRVFRMALFEPRNSPTPAYKFGRNAWPPPYD
jgi:hypothetical protein